jgi:hypothetical protein
MAYGVQVLLAEWRAPEAAPQSGNSWDAKNKATTDVVKYSPLLVTSHVPLHLTHFKHSEATALDYHRVISATVFNYQYFHTSRGVLLPHPECSANYHGTTATFLPLCYLLDIIEHRYVLACISESTQFHHLYR